MQRRTALFVPFLLASGLAAKAGARAAYRGPVFQEVATSEYQWNSTAVSRTGRVFTSFPTRNEFPSFHVGELRGGVTVSFLPRDVNESLVNVSNIFIDDADRLWILDSGKLAGRPVNKSAARLICVNITHRMVLQTFRIPSELLESNSTLANVRVDSQQNIAFISDGGAGGLIVLDLESGKGWLGLDRFSRPARTRSSSRSRPAITTRSCRTSRRLPFQKTAARSTSRLSLKPRFIRFRLIFFGIAVFAPMTGPATS